MMETRLQGLTHLAFTPLSSASLCVFRILFGLVNALGVVRFISKGWLEELYVEPLYHFRYFGFEWVPVPSELALKWIFAGLFVSSLGVMMGLFYRLSIVSFFVLFTWIELIDVATYLNHYYLVSLIAFLMIWMPANVRYAIDTYLPFKSHQRTVPSICLVVLRMQLGITYVFAGIAKLNYDWLVSAQPLTIWMRRFETVPVLGGLLVEPASAYAMSWSGALFDLCIPFLLVSRKTRLPAFCIALVFHSLTGLLFNIGVFPIVMMVAITLFFPPEWPDTLFGRTILPDESSQRFETSNWIVGLAGCYMLVQLLLPLRHWLYPGSSAWTEQGYRFSWNVMRIEKTGMVEFIIRDPRDGVERRVYPRDRLTTLQVKMMATQPDLILAYAHELAGEFARIHGVRPEVRVDSWAALNGRRSQRFIDPDVDLAAFKRGWAHKFWILPLNIGNK